MLESGEMIGDIELVNNLSSYMHTVTCAAHTTLYILTPKNFERLINAKNNRSALTKLRKQVEKKLGQRVSSQQGSQVPLLKHLLFKMTEEIQAKPPVVPPLRGSKELPDQAVLFQHLLTVFKENKAELIEPHVPGGVYYREMMRQRANHRQKETNPRQQRFRKSLEYGSLIQQQQEESTRKKKKRLSKRDFSNKVPRSSVALKAAMELEKQREEEMQRRIITQAIREREEQEVRLMYEQQQQQKKQQEEDHPTTEPKKPRSQTVSEQSQGKDLMNQGLALSLSRQATMTLDRIKTFLTEVDATSEPGDIHREPTSVEDQPKRPESAAPALPENTDEMDEIIKQNNKTELETQQTNHQQTNHQQTNQEPINLEGVEEEEIAE